MKRHPLLLFFIAAFAITWPFLILEALGSQGVTQYQVPFPLLLLMAYGPTIAALFVTGLYEGKPGIAALLGQFLRRPVGIQWFLIAIFGMAGLFFLAYRISIWFGYPQPPAPELPISPILAAPVLLIVSLLTNGEEVGWRGFALPRLQARYSAFNSSLILGLVWAVFHLPLFWTIGSTQAGQPMAGFFVAVLAMSVIVTWLYNNTGGSLLIVTLFHASANTWSRIIPGIDTAHSAVGPIYWMTIGLTVLAAVLVTLVYGRENLSRRAERQRKIDPLFGGEVTIETGDQTADKLPIPISPVSDNLQDLNPL